jgi:hypothetical protein
MRWISVAALLSCAAFTALGQQDHALKFGNTIRAEDLRKHLTIVAGAEMEGRETGTEGQRKAAAYIEEQFRKMGLVSPSALKGHQQYFPLYTDSMRSSELLIGDRRPVYGTDYYVQASKNRSCSVSANSLVFVGYGVSEPGYDDYAGKDVNGKIVVLFTGEPKADGKFLVSGDNNISLYTFPGIEKKSQVARKKGAAGMIIIQQGTKELSSGLVATNSKSNLYYPSSGEEAFLSSLVMPTRSALSFFSEWKMDSLVRKAAKNQPLNNESAAELNRSFSFVYTNDRDTVLASNVLGIIPGSDLKDEYIYVTAHYDHLGKRGNKIYYGADDDGSGTCAVLEIAEAFAQAKAAGHGPRRTVVCMTVSGEEKGLWGSEYYTDNPLFALDKTSVDLNIDMVGRKDPNRKEGDNNNYVYVIGHDKLSTELPVINEGANKKYTRLEFDYKYDDPEDPEHIFYRSDHYNFARKGVPILFFFDGIHEDYHKTTDTVDKINFDLYEKRIRMIFHTAWEIANRKEMLKRDMPLPPLSY